MGKLQELETVQAIIQDILTHDEMSRNSDDYLYLRVCEHINPLCTRHPFNEIILHRKDYGYPPFESVRRARQKLQAENEELAGCRKVTKKRKELVEEHKAFARKRQVK